MPNNPFLQPSVYELPFNVIINMLIVSFI